MFIRRAWVIVLCLLLVSCEVFDKEARDQYDAAMKQWDAGAYEQSVEQFVAMVKAHPYSPLADNALYWIGVTQFLYLGETDRALATLRLLLKKYPRRDMAAAAQLKIAEIYDLGYNDYPRAIEEYRRAAAYTDKDVRERSLYSLAENLFRVGKFDEARDTWLLQVKEFPRGKRTDVAYYRLGTLSFSSGRIDTAEGFYRQALEVSRDQELAIKAKFSLAQCLEAKDRLKEALALYKEIEPSYGNKKAITIKIKALETRILKKSY